MDNIIGRENLITVGRQMNSPVLYGQNILVQLQKLMADRTGLDSTMLHYLAVWQAMVSVHTDPYIRKSH